MGHVLSSEGSVAVSVGVGTRTLGQAAVVHAVGGSCSPPDHRPVGHGFASSLAAVPIQSDVEYFSLRQSLQKYIRAEFDKGRGIPRNKFDAIEWKIEYGRLQLEKVLKMKSDIVCCRDGWK